MIIFQCTACGEMNPCLLVCNNDADVPEHCPWDGGMEDADWNSMRVTP